MFERKYNIIALQIVTSLLVFGSLASNAQKPNIIYIMTDDMGYGDLGCYGQTKIKTPQIDKLAAQGVKFVNCYAAAPLCTPTRTAFMTGRYPARTPVGLIEPLTGLPADSAFGLNSETPSFVSQLKMAGYSTALIGKWHLGTQPKHHPNRNGFDYFFGFKAGALDYISHRNPAHKPDLFENDLAIRKDGYLTEIFALKADEYIRKKHSQPFFLAVMFNAPHWPWQRRTDEAYHDTANFRSGGSPEIYEGMMKSLDSAIGKILQAVDSAHLTTNTIIIFTNDNGGERFSNNGGLSKGKSTLWEGGIRVPAIMRWPGRIQPGTTTEQVAVTMDWSVTILSAAGLQAANNFDGINLLPIVANSKKPIERTLFWRSFQRTKQKAVRNGNWKYLQDENGEYLFDLNNDPAEKVDLSKKDKDNFSRLKKMHEDWEKTVLQPIAL